jgi:hypothetical protein
MTWTEKILDLSVVTDKKLIAAEGAAHFWWDKDIYYIEYKLYRIFMKQYMILLHVLLVSQNA